MSMHHHPSEAILTAYASGSLPESLSLVVATHLSLCPACRQTDATLEAVGGALLDDLPVAAMEQDALAHALALIETPARREPIAAPAPLPPGIVAPGPLAGYVAGGKWRRVLPGIAVMPVVSGQLKRGGAYLIRVAPGIAISHHGHEGRELSLILDGAYQDELGRFAKGDFEETDESIEHRPIVAGDIPCTCLIATEGRLRFTGLFARALQGIVGI